MKKISILLLLLNIKLWAATWKIGSTQTYTTPSAVVSLVQDNDTIKIDGGIYLNDPVSWTKKNLVFIGLGTGSNRSIIKWNGGDIANGKGLWVFGSATLNGNITIDNIVFEGARVSDANGGNGAGIRYQAKNLVIRNCLFSSCQNGILEGGSYSGSAVSITDTEFFNCGYELTGAVHSGYEHAIYISAQTDSLLVKNCYFHDPRGEGNSVKTRAQKSYILYNLIDEASGKGSWEINIAQGGLNVIIGNTIIQGPNSINHGIVSYDAATNPAEDFYFIHNTVINKYAGNFSYFNVTPASGINKYKIYNNIFATLLGSTMTNFIAGTPGAALDTSANRILPNYLTVGFVNASSNNFKLTSGATSFINNAASSGTASNGFALTPISEFNGPNTSLSPRTMAGGANDIGAYEYFTATGIFESRTLNPVICYPNPATEGLTIDLGSFTPSARTEVIIFNVCEQEIKRIPLGEAKTFIPVSDIARGVYFYRIEQDKTKITAGKVIVK
jgi:hypothetical protein